MDTWIVTRQIATKYLVELNSFEIFFLGVELCSLLDCSIVLSELDSFVTFVVVSISGSITPETRAGDNGNTVGFGATDCTGTAALRLSWKCVVAA